MKCKSCESEINPKWKYAIDSNICPFCGQTVMDENLKTLFSSLRNIMDQLLEYQDQIDDWMLSNYSYIKTDSPKLVDYIPTELLKNTKVKPEIDSKKFTVKVMTENGEEEVEAEKTQSEEETNEFFKRAEAVKPRIDGFNSTAEKTQHLKKMLQQIKKSGSPSITTGNMISAEMLEQADPEAVAEMQSLLSGGNDLSSSLSDNMEDDDIPAVVQSMANMAQGSNANVNATKDLLKLQQMQNRVHNSRKSFESGENRGKGGFSRAG